MGVGHRSSVENNQQTAVDEPVVMVQFHTAYDRICSDNNQQYHIVVIYQKEQSGGSSRIKQGYAPIIAT